MTIEDFLMPGEEIRYHGPPGLNYGGKLYEVIITDKRLLLFARRGAIFKKDDVVSQKVDEVQNILYKETGILRKEGILEIIARTRFVCSGKPNQVKAIYHQLLQFF